MLLAAQKRISLGIGARVAVLLGLTLFYTPSPIYASYSICHATPSTV